MPGKHHLRGFKIAKKSARRYAARDNDDAPHRRWVKPPLGKKLDPPLMGDEFHFVFQCPFKYIPSYFRIRPNTLKMSTLCNAKDVITMSKLAKFVKIIMTEFKR